MLRCQAPSLKGWAALPLGRRPLSLCSVSDRRTQLSSLSDLLNCNRLCSGWTGRSSHERARTQGAWARPRAAELLITHLAWRGISVLVPPPATQARGGGAAVLRPLSSNVQPPPKQLQRWFSSTSSSSESDAEPAEASPPDTAVRAALFRKLGIAGGGWESDSSAYYSSPDRPGGPRAEGGSNGVAATPTTDADRAQRTIAALREELAAARQQADAASAELRTSDQQCRLLQVGFM